MLWRLRTGVAICLAVALLAALWTNDRISLAPPGLTSRSLEMATASTQMVVDTPTSILLDLRQDTYSFEGLRNRAVLLGNVMAGMPVRTEIARRAHLPVEVLQVAAPRTPEQPRAVVGADTGRKATDILKSTDQFRLSIQANPTVPILDVFAQAPDAATAETLANAAVDALRSELGRLAHSERTPVANQIHVMQLGRAHGAVINGGVRWQAAILAFLITLGASCATLVFLDRMRTGWRLAALADEPAAVE